MIMNFMDATSTMDVECLEALRACSGGPIPR